MEPSLLNAKQQGLKALNESLGIMEQYCIQFKCFKIQASARIKWHLTHILNQPFIDSNKWNLCKHSNKINLCMHYETTLLPNSLHWNACNWLKD